jgi:hypothetical protein
VGSNEFQWSEWGEYLVLGNRWMDCIGRPARRPSASGDRESATWPTAELVPLVTMQRFNESRGGQPAVERCGKQPRYNRGSTP